MKQFIIHHKITSKDSTNAIYSGKHWQARKNQADYWHKLTMSEMRKQVPKCIAEKPVMITISYNSKLDLDNHGYLAKMIIDGMKGWLIHDDTRKYVTCLLQKFHEYADDQIIVEVIEL